MILVLEGAMGSGKSTMARLLSEQLGWPVYRAFRLRQDGHKPGSTQPWTRGLPLPINTWLEDLYTADFAQTIKPNVILDRSMPSAIAYEELGWSKADEWHKLRSASMRILAIRAWVERMASADARVVMFKGKPQLLRRRSGNRATVEAIGREQEAIERACRIARLPLLIIRNVDRDRHWKSSNLRMIMLYAAEALDANLTG